MSAGFLPWFAGLVTPIVSHATSGTATTAMISSILFLTAITVGYNPAILARIIPGTAPSLCFPWGGAAAATAFSFGTLTLRDMVRVGIVALILNTLVVIVTTSSWCRSLRRSPRPDR